MNEGGEVGTDLISHDTMHISFFKVLIKERYELIDGGTYFCYYLFTEIGQLILKRGSVAEERP